MTCCLCSVQTVCMESRCNMCLFDKRQFGSNSVLSSLRFWLSRSTRDREGTHRLMFQTICSKVRKFTMNVCCSRSRSLSRWLRRSTPSWATSPPWRRTRRTTLKMERRSNATRRNSRSMTSLRQLAGRSRQR